MHDSTSLTSSTTLISIKSMQRGVFASCLKILHSQTNLTVADRYSASVVMALAYGKTPQSYDDPDVVAVNRCLTRLGNNLRPGMWKVDTYPFLRYVVALIDNSRVHRSLISDNTSYIPGYLKELQDGHDEELKLFKRQLRDVKIKMVSSTRLHPLIYSHLIARF